MSELIVGAQTPVKKEGDVIEIRNASILKRGNKKNWVVRYDVFINGKIVEERKEQSTKVGLKEKSRKYMQNRFLPAWKTKKEEDLRKARAHSTKFSYYASLYLEDYKRNRDYYSVEKKVQRVVADFGEKEIAEITKLEVRRWINNLPNSQTGKELTRATRNKYKTIFNQVFEFALDDDIIERNFIPEIKVVGKESDENAIKTFSPPQVRLILEKSKDTRRYGELLRPYLGLVFNEGISPSEAIGLQVGDIKIDENGKRYLHIQRGVTKNRVGETKNLYRYRKIVLRDAAAEYVDILLKLAKERNSIWLFSKKDGSRLTDIENIRGTKAHFNKEKGYYEHRASKWYKLLEDLDLEHRDIKNCRHTFTIAALQSKKYSYMELADMLGHSDTQMIIHHYAKDIRGRAMNIDASFDIYSGDVLGDSQSYDAVLELESVV